MLELWSLGVNPTLHLILNVTLDMFFNFSLPEFLMCEKWKIVIHHRVIGRSK